MRFTLHSPSRMEILPHIQASGYVSIANAVSILREAGLHPNPRSPKMKPIVREIIGTLKENPTMFPFMNRGLTIAVDSLSLEALPRLNCDISFTPDHGLLDGGHTSLAMISWAYGKSLNNWSEAEVALEGSIAIDPEVYNQTLVPVTLVCTDAKTLCAISGTKNRSAPVSAGALRANQGTFDFLRGHLDSSLDRVVKWRDQQEGAHVDIGDLVNLCHLHLHNALPKHLQPCMTYKNKSASLEKISNMIAEGGAVIEDSTTSLTDLVALYERIQMDYATLYNRIASPFSDEGGTRRFGMLHTNGKRASQPTHFYRRKLTYTVPKALVYPCMYAVIARCINDEGLLAHDLIEAWETHGEALVRVYSDLLDGTRTSSGKLPVDALHNLASRIHVYQRLKTEIMSR